MMVLDAWAIMAWLKGQQPAADRVRHLLEAAERREKKLLMNIVNLGEVFYVSVKARDLAYGERVLDTLRPRLTGIPATDPLVMAAATLKSRHAISYADAFAAATALLREYAASDRRSRTPDHGRRGEESKARMDCERINHKAS